VIDRLRPISEKLDRALSLIEAAKPQAPES
jgi:hypothetical protein